MLSATLLVSILLAGGARAQTQADLPQPTGTAVEEELPAAPGDALILREGPPPPRPVGPPMPAPVRSSSPAAASGAAVVMLASGGYALTRRSRPTTDLFPTDVAVVFVGGWGSESGTGFNQITTHLGIPPGQAVYFDYESVGGTNSSSSQEIAGALDALVRSQDNPQLRGRQVYLVGFSKGGAAIAELVAAWDVKPNSRPYQVMGAALLDPPIADGLLGDLQSAGKRFGLPNDGGFDPVVCSPHQSSACSLCTDKRDHLGRKSGTDVVVFRSPDTLNISNFSDRPPGLEVVTIDDPGPSPVEEALGPLPVIGVRYPPVAVGGAVLRGGARVIEAHGYVAKAPEVWKRIGQEITVNRRPPAMKRGRWFKVIRIRPPKDRRRMGRYVP